MFPDRRVLGSVALLPLLRQQRLIGSINLGSADAGRFERGQGTDFLQHLAVIASFALENAVNRARLTRSGFTDVLTGWHNRRYLQTRLHEELGRAQRASQPLSCLMLDLDYFKTVNDTWGHLAGDAVLSELVHRIEGEIRVSDVAARYGGEEFVILLIDSGPRRAATIAERIRAAVADTPFDLPDSERIDVTVSIGLATLDPAPDNRDLKSLGAGLIASADAALYRAKGAGRNRVAGEVEPGER